MSPNPIKLEIIDFKDNILTLTISPKEIGNQKNAKEFFKTQKFTIEKKVFDSFLESERKDVFFKDFIEMYPLIDAKEDN